MFKHKDGYRYLRLRHPIPHKLKYNTFLLSLTLLSTFTPQPTKASSGVFYKSPSSISITSNSQKFLGSGDLILNGTGDSSAELPSSIKSIYANYKTLEDSNDSDSVVNTTGNLEAIDFYAGYSQQGNSDKNTLFINNGKFNKVKGGYTSSANGTSNNNSITIYDGIFNQEITTGTSKNGEANNNTLNIYSGTYKGSLYGAYSSNSGNLSNNTINIYGGSFSNYITGASTQTGSTENNKILLDGNIYVPNSLTIYATYTNGITRDNRIILGPNLTISGNSSNIKIFGNHTVNTDTSKNNTLEIYGSNLSFSSISNFNNYYFILPSFITNGTTIISTISPVDLTNSNIGIALNSQSKLNKGDKITLFSNATGSYDLVSINNDDITYATDIYVLDNKESALIQSNNKKKYNIDLSYNDKSLDLTILDIETIEETVPTLKPESKYLFTSRLPEVLSLSSSIQNVSDLVLDLDPSSKGFTPDIYTEQSTEIFGKISGNTGKLKTQPNIYYDNVNILSGLSYDITSRTKLGLFFEGGHTNYETKDEFSINGYDNTNSSGEINYSGGGLFLHQNIYKHYNKGIFLTSHISSGSIRNSWNYPYNEQLSYRINNHYYSGHLGLGYKQYLGNNISYELYTKYGYGHISKEELRIEEDKVKFKALTSKATSISNKLYYHPTKNIFHYIGSTISKENKGKSEGSINEIEVSQYKNSPLYSIKDTPTLTGTTLSLEYGIGYHPTSSQLQTTFNIKHYTGKQHSTSTAIYSSYYW